LDKKIFFGIPKLSDIGRSLENVLGQFQKFGPWLILVMVTFLENLQTSGNLTAVLEILGN